ncbi:protein ERGIC-53-like isoform X2 [Bos indicus x Bos taurus]|uniref:protein ERGIC-53-like isoform X2 n=1 Tax=Bos indicus x Bos taurus TaxID=30522 RepID=UPI000F7D1117|nr:protein ERGIC-53-like isoform X2 [Bos indicus x Bos taurus]
MRVVRGLDPLLCLLLLVLLDPHSPEMGHLPQRRFEYKLSFKGPRLALPGVGIPFWSHHGDAIPGLEEVRLAPSMRNRSGAVWSTNPVLFPAWEVEIQMRVTGPGRWGAQGMAVWYTRGRGQVGPVLGEPDLGDGIGILFDSSAQDPQNSPAIYVLARDRHTLYEPLGDGGSLLLGSCRQDFRNRPYPFRARITYWGQRLRVSLNSGLTPSDPEEVCVDVGPLLLAPGGFFGVSAATSILADDHDVLSFLTFSLWEPGPEPPSQPFLETEQLRLAKQLEGLQARLGLGTKEDMTPELNYGVWEEGEQSFGLEETLHRHSQILQALQGLSKHLMQAERQWKQQLGSPGHIRPEGGWDSAKVSALLLGQRTLLQDLQEMRMERDAQFTQRKAERATLRSHFRDKYRLPKNETDESQIQMAGGDVELPRELAKMIEEDTEEEEERASVLGQLASLPGLDLGSLKDKAQSTLGDLKQSAEKCHIM